MKAANKVPKRIAFIITGLNTGGAEMMLYKLLSRMNRERFESVVISLMDLGKMGDRISALDIPIYTIGMKSGISTPESIWQFIRTLRQIKPVLIQGWMYHGNLAAQLAGVFLPKPVSILWNVRQSLYSLEYEKKGTAAVIKLCAYLSFLPEKIIYNSRISAEQHEQISYDKNKSLIITNGFDTEQFAPDPEARWSLCQELEIPANVVLIGLIGRYHPMKDHPNFLKSAALLLKNNLAANVQFVLAGQGVDWYNQHLCQLAKDLNLVEKIHLLGERHDIPRLTAALDIACSSSSHSEGFPNIIGEAMSCGVPCVVTKVGDSPWIVGETGRVVPRCNPQALANAWKELINLGTEGRTVLGKAARERVIENFSLDSVVAEYEALYESVLARKLN